MHMQVLNCKWKFLYEMDMGSPCKYAFGVAVVFAVALSCVEWCGVVWRLLIVFGCVPLVPSPAQPGAY